MRCADKTVIDKNYYLRYLSDRVGNNSEKKDGKPKGLALFFFTTKGYNQTRIKTLIFIIIMI